MASSRIFCYFQFRPVQVRIPLLSRSFGSLGERDIVHEYRKVKSMTPAMQYSIDKKVSPVNFHRNATEKEKSMYQDQYVKNMHTFFDELYDYIKQIRDISKLGYEEQKIVQRALLFQKNKLDKPQRPLNEYIMYVKDNYNENKNLSQLAESWLKLDDSAKKKYKEIAHENLTKYKESLNVWEKKMLKQGHYLLVRKNTRQEYEKKK